jgi:hypothetical protein
MPHWLGPLAVLTVAGLAPAEPLPRIDSVPWPALRRHAQDLLRALAHEKADLPAETTRALRDLLAGKAPADDDEAGAVLQQLLDPYCLVGVTINPESRVKVARGPAAARLQVQRPTVVLIKVHNDAGVTHALAVAGPQLRSADQPAEGRWLSAAVLAPPPLAAKLSGRRLEYMLLRLTPHEAGKREANLRFDVGQGSQDLGFRGEVPILFTVR